MRLNYRFYVPAILLSVCLALTLNIKGRQTSIDVTSLDEPNQNPSITEASGTNANDQNAASDVVLPNLRFKIVDRLKVPLLRAEYWQARTDGEALWMDERGFPEDMDILKWPRQEIEQLAATGSLRAKNQMMHLRLEAGEENWGDADAIRFGSLYFARLRASYELGLIGPGLAALHQRLGYLTPEDRSVRQVVKGLAFDFLAQRMGDESQLRHLHEHTYSRGSPAFAAVDEIYAAQKYAEEIWITWNQNRQRNGMPLLENKYGARREMMAIRVLDPNTRALIQRQIKHQLQNAPPTR